MMRHPGGKRSITEVVLLKGRYELLKTLGSGGEARVVKALDHEHARLVALKMRPARANLAGMICPAKPGSCSG